MSNMRHQQRSFEELVDQNKQELLQDKERLSEIEERLERKMFQQNNEKDKKLTS